MFKGSIGKKRKRKMAIAGFAVVTIAILAVMWWKPVERYVLPRICGEWSAEEDGRDIIHLIEAVTEIDVHDKKVNVVDFEDYHGWFGDGYTYALLKLEPIETDALSEQLIEGGHWGRGIAEDYAGNSIYMGGTFGEEYNFPKVTGGFYYFFDRYEEKYGEKSLDGYSSTNFDAAVLDVENNLLYFGTFDS